LLKKGELMAKIRVMSETLANQIAAGEVVERPASVVKELVENSMDAEADQIDVEIHGSGCRTIRVFDNGIGMEEDDVLLAFERHATSKIHSEADLTAINTLGFRGEALPSLAAVSKFEITSRTRESTAGTRIRVAAGVVKEVVQCGCPPGTQVWVRDLFFAQPARRKFLKTERTEFAHIVDTLTRLALARPEIHFSLRHKGRFSHDWPAAMDLRQRLAQIFPKAASHSWLICTGQQGFFDVRGWLSPPEQYRSNTGMLFLYVNGRPVRDRLLSMAIAEAYRTLLPKGKFPLGVLSVNLPAELVDVNVHPTKAEVRFQDPKTMTKVVTLAVQNGLRALKSQRWQRPLAVSPRLPISAAPAQKELRSSGFTSQQIAEPLPQTYEASSSVGPDSVMAEQEAGVLDREQRNGRLSGDLSLIGQLHQAYLVCESSDGLILIDQHAAHERIHFETLREQATGGSLASQVLAVPATIELTAEEGAWLEESLSLFERLGFGLDPFGANTFIIRAVPAMALRQDPVELLTDLVSVACAGGSDPSADMVLEKLLQSMACRLAIKAGKRLGQEEMVALMRQLDDLDLLSTCPHGRPLWWKLTMTDLERVFGRS
jgi:DNA mismatch repair protein MutL